MLKNLIVFVTTLALTTEARSKDSSSAMLLPTRGSTELGRELTDAESAANNPNLNPNSGADSRGRIVEDEE